MSTKAVGREREQRKRSRARAIEPHQLCPLEFMLLGSHSQGVLLRFFCQAGSPRSLPLGLPIAPPALRKTPPTLKAHLSSALFFASHLYLEAANSQRNCANASSTVRRALPFLSAPSSPPRRTDSMATGAPRQGDETRCKLSNEPQGTKCALDLARRAQTGRVKVRPPLRARWPAGTPPPPLLLGRARARARAPSRPDGPPRAVVRALGRAMPARNESHRVRRASRKSGRSFWSFGSSGSSAGRGQRRAAMSRLEALAAALSSSDHGPFLDLMDEHVRADRVERRGRRRLKLAAKRYLSRCTVNGVGGGGRDVQGPCIATSATAA